MPTEMTTVTTSADYHVAAGEHLVFTNQVGFQLSQPIVGGTWARPSPHLTISGEVEVVMTSSTASGAGGMTGINISNTLDASPTVSLDPGGVLRVTVTGGTAFGYFGGGSAAPTFNNAGTVIVSADGDAKGLHNQANSGVLINSGHVSVTSTTANATGLAAGGAGYRVEVHNSGDITVFGHGHVVGVDMVGGTGEVFHNTGSIVAHDDSATQTSVGVYWANGPQPGLLGSFINDGTIEADRAIEVDISFGAAADNLIVNNGRLIGQVWMGGGGAQTLVNNGVIDGTVRLIGAGSLYDGRLGTALGEIVASNNPGGNTLLGGAGAETLTGGFSNDTISGGAGDDLIDGGRGDDVLDGGAGVNTLSLTHAGAAASVDLGAQTASFGGAKTIANFQAVIGGGLADTLVGGAGAETLSGGAGNDQIYGRLGNDVIDGGAGSNVLRGDEGDDQVSGGTGFDDINGNMGADTLHGNAGGDWVLGGKDNDVVFGDDGDDIVNGNLGDDVCDGGAGADTVRGGQSDDVLRGGAGNDWLSGDRGTDQITGGAGADTFHLFDGSEMDWVQDFSAAEGDRVVVDAGLTWSAYQFGSDTVIDVAGGRMMLVGVQLASLPAGWILAG